MPHLSATHERECRSEEERWSEMEVNKLILKYTKMGGGGILKKDGALKGEWDILWGGEVRPHIFCNQKAPSP